MGWNFPKKVIRLKAGEPFPCSSEASDCIVFDSEPNSSVWPCIYPSEGDDQPTVCIHPELGEKIAEMVGERNMINTPQHGKTYMQQKVISLADMLGFTPTKLNIDG